MWGRQSKSRPGIRDRPGLLVSRPRLASAHFDWALEDTVLSNLPSAALATDKSVISRGRNYLPLATEKNLRTRRGQAAREDQQGSDERGRAVFRDTASLVTSTGSSRLPLNPVLECVEMRWTLGMSALGKLRHLAACWPPSTPSTSQQGLRSQGVGTGDVPSAIDHA